MDQTASAVAPVYRYVHRGRSWRGVLSRYARRIVSIAGDVLKTVRYRQSPMQMEEYGDIGFSYNRFVKSGITGQIDIFSDGGYKNK